MVKINDFYVGFNKQWSVFSPGETVSGYVTFDFGDKIFADQVVAQFYGSARIFWTERELKPPHGVQSVAYSQEKVYFDEKRVLWGEENTQSNEKNLEQVLAQSSSGLRLKNVHIEDDKRPSLQKGQHKMHFEFCVPEFGIPTSYDAKHAAGYIRYYVKASVMEWGQVKHSRKGFFTVVRSLDLNTIPRALGTATQSAERAVSKLNVLCMGSATPGRVSGLLTMQKCGYVPGEQLRISVEVDNQSDRSVKHVQASLMQHTTCYADQPEYKMKSSSFIVASTGMQQKKIVRRQAILFEPILYVPAVVPTFTIDCCMEVSYSVKVEVSFDRRESSPIFIVEIPVVIGTVPVGAHFQSPSLQHRIVSPATPSVAPPSYYENELLLDIRKSISLCTVQAINNPFL
uniref:Arrestin C-terminal-like domain-containing protein n=1 Tax=Plectus sambesii TaxID=2011161 RepID=A0A914W3L5_9BILA